MLKEIVIGLSRPAETTRFCSIRFHVGARVENDGDNGAGDGDGGYDGYDGDDCGDGDGDNGHDVDVDVDDMVVMSIFVLAWVPSSVVPLGEGKTPGCAGADIGASAPTQVRPAAGRRRGPRACASRSVRQQDRQHQGRCYQVQAALITCVLVFHVCGPTGVSEPLVWVWVCFVFPGCKHREVRAVATSRHQGLMRFRCDWA